MKSKLDKDFWRRYLSVYDSLKMLIPYKRLLCLILENINPQENDNILDAGAGTGNLVVMLVKGGARVVALDNLPEALQVLREKEPAAKTVIHDLKERLPFNNSTFSKIVCNNTLYSIPHCKHIGIIKEFKRILQKGGFLVLSNPLQGAKPSKIFIEHLRMFKKKNGIVRLFLELFLYLRNIILILYYNIKIKRNSKIGEFHFFAKGEQEELLRKLGFNIIESLEVYAKQNELVIAQYV